MQNLSRRGPAPSREGLGGATLVERMRRQSSLGFAVSIYLYALPGRETRRCRTLRLKVRLHPSGVDPLDRGCTPPNRLAESPPYDLERFPKGSGTRQESLTENHMLTRQHSLAQFHSKLTCRAAFDSAWAPLKVTAPVGAPARMPRRL